MEIRTFNSIMPNVNEKWVAKVLNMKKNNCKGVDLIDNEKIIEVKFSLIYGKTKYAKWNVMEHQIEYPEIEEKIGFWAMGTYQLRKEVSKIKRSEITNLEKLVTDRKLYIIPWNWINKFNPYLTSGKTEKSEWEITFRYTKLKYIPPITKIIPVEKGQIFLTEGVNPLYFEKIGKNLEENEFEDCPF